MDVLIRTRSVASDQNPIQSISNDEKELIGLCFGQFRGIGMTSGVAGSRCPNDIAWILPLPFHFSSVLSSGLASILDRISSPRSKVGHGKAWSYTGLTVSDPRKISLILYLLYPYEFPKVTLIGPIL